MKATFAANCGVGWPLDSSYEPQPPPLPAKYPSHAPGKKPAWECKRNYNRTCPDGFNFDGVMCHEVLPLAASQCCSALQRAVGKVAQEEEGEELDPLALEVMKTRILRTSGRNNNRDDAGLGAHNCSVWDPMSWKGFMTGFGKKGRGKGKGKQSHKDKEDKKRSDDGGPKEATTEDPNVEDKAPQEKQKGGRGLGKDQGGHGKGPGDGKRAAGAGSNKIPAAQASGQKGKAGKDRGKGGKGKDDRGKDSKGNGGKGKDSKGKGKGARDDKSRPLGNVPLNMGADIPSGALTWNPDPSGMLGRPARPNDSGGSYIVEEMQRSMAQPMSQALPGMGAGYAHMPGFLEGNNLNMQNMSLQNLNGLQGLSGLQQLQSMGMANHAFAAYVQQNQGTPQGVNAPSPAALGMPNFADLPATLRNPAASQPCRGPGSHSF
ncbi:unnamed protein product [Durusdinium trenchii]|uniref:Uncharacterized protein n=1 Tax=Durusdinium trenchii TaxID=1381693 RepID=A0ABP0I611_9DINO